MSEKLKQCPFCGGDVYLNAYSTIQTLRGNYVDIHPAYQVRCSNCNIFLECADLYRTLDDNKKAIIEAWNGRV